MNMFLKKRMEAKKNKKKGFTLIEVIVVIVIIAILAAIAVPSLTRYIGQAGLRADMAMGHNLQVVLQAELSDQFVNGISWTPDATEGPGSTINSVTVSTVLADNGMTLPPTTQAVLSDITVDTSSARLLGFQYQTTTSTVTFGAMNSGGSGGLEQDPNTTLP